MTLQKDFLVPEGHSKPIGNYSPGIAVRVPADARWVFVTGQVATDAAGGVVAPDDAGKQTEVVFDRIRAVLAAAGGELADVVSLTFYLSDLATDFDRVSAVRNEVLAGLSPTSTLVEVARLAETGCRVEISAIAIVPAGRG
ncbi:RidA family protein [Saccharopolyspora shandongensis]|uniref:RidA family protein n=1 Tax=Saccharopolyspora shandongensis TaxID=418495 RepID=UPI0033D3CD1E